MVRGGARLARWVLDEAVREVSKGIADEPMRMTSVHWHVHERHARHAAAAACDNGADDGGVRAYVIERNLVCIGRNTPP